MGKDEEIVKWTGYSLGVAKDAARAAEILYRFATDNSVAKAKVRVISKAGEEFFLEAEGRALTAAVADGDGEAFLERMSKTLESGMALSASVVVTTADGGKALADASPKSDGSGYVMSASVGSVAGSPEADAVARDLFGYDPFG